MSEPTVERIPQHRHCEKCGKAFVGDDRFCSEDCRTTASSEVKRQLRKLGLIWVALVAVVVVCVVITI